MPRLAASMDPAQATRFLSSATRRPVSVYLSAVRRVAARKAAQSSATSGGGSGTTSPGLLRALGFVTLGEGEVSTSGGEAGAPGGDVVVGTVRSRSGPVTPPCAPP